MGRHRGAKTRTGDDVFEQKWRRLHAAGKVVMEPGSKGEPPWLDAQTLVAQAIGAYARDSFMDEYLSRTQREALCELAVNACVKDGACALDLVEALVRTIRTNGFRPGFVDALREAYPRISDPSA